MLPPTQNYHSSLWHVANINKQVAIAPRLIGALDEQGTIGRRPGAPVHDEASTPGDVRAGNRNSQLLCSTRSSPNKKKETLNKQGSKTGRNTTVTYQLEVALLPFLESPVIWVLPRRQKLWPLTVETQGWLPRLAR